MMMKEMPSSNPQSAIRNPQSEDRALAAWEILAVVASVLIAEWVVFALAGESALALLFPISTILIFMQLSHRVRCESARDLGWRLDNFWQAVRLLALPMLGVIVFLVVVGMFNSRLDFTRWEGGQSLFGIPALSLLWGPLQQYALQGFVNRRAQIVWGRGWKSVTATAVVFALLHMPNPWLTLATFGGGLLWAWVYQRAPNLLAVGLSHGLLTWVLVSSVPPAALHNLRVGFKYFG
ncbi:MAG: CPBP family intramembrane metalloprotease [Rubrivivax sp.]|nr:CPBP family intramembrane metalloprotease [Pyrinomonadaceae bacterium]